MILATVLIALLWGMFSGYLMLRVADSILASFLCLHGLWKVRWAQLARNVTVKLVKPAVIWRLLLRMILYCVLFAGLLRLGYTFTRQQLGFEYGGWGVLLYGVVAAITVLSRLPAARQRLLLVWRLSHEFDYAEKRRRTQMLKT